MTSVESDALHKSHAALKMMKKIGGLWLAGVFYGDKVYHTLHLVDEALEAHKAMNAENTQRDLERKAAQEYHVHTLTSGPLPSSPPPVEPDPPIPTHAEHQLFIKRIWVVCITMAFLVFVGTGGVVMALFAMGYETQKVVEVSTAVFQVIVLSYGLGFFVPAFLTSLCKMSLGVVMSRKGLDVGEKTAQHIDRLQAELTPVIDNLKTAVNDVTEMIDRVKKENFDSLQKTLDELSAGGKLTQAVEAVASLPAKIDELKEKGKKDLIKRL